MDTITKEGDVDDVTMTTKGPSPRCWAVEYDGDAGCSLRFGGHHVERLSRRGFAEWLVPVLNNLDGRNAPLFGEDAAKPCPPPAESTPTPASPQRGEYVDLLAAAESLGSVYTETRDLLAQAECRVPLDVGVTVGLLFAGCEAVVAAAERIEKGVVA